MHFPCVSFSKVLPSLLVSSALTLLTACGGGGGGSDSSETASTPPEVRTSTVAGTVNKGIVSNGLVSIYALDQGSTGELLASTRTDANGQFTINIGTHDGPVYIEVTTATSGEATLMTCDTASGCGDFTLGNSHDSNSNGSIDFGERFPVAMDFRLSAALPSSSLTTTTSISTLTHLAAQLASQFPQGLNDISIATALSQVQNLFGLDGSLTSLRAVDLTNSSAVSSASTAELRYALLSSALLGLTNDVAFQDTLTALTSDFQSNAGQLLQQDDEDNQVSLNDLVTQALATAQHLNLVSLTTEFQQLQTTLLAAAEGILTDSQPSPNAGGATAAAIEAFLADLRLWQGQLSLNPQQASFADSVNALGISTGSDLSSMLQSVAIAGQYGPVVALPNLALSAACDSLTNYFARMTCRLLIAGKSLEQICEGALNLYIGSRSLCDFLNDLTLPLGNGLYGHFALYDGVARIYGSVQDNAVNLTFTRTTRSNTTYGFSVTGTVESASGLMTINSGNVQMVFDGGLDIRDLQLPEEARGTLNVAYEQIASDSHPDTMTFDGDINLSLDLSNVRESEEEEGTYAGLDQIGLDLSAAGQFASSTGTSFSGSLTISGGLDSTVEVQFETDTPDYADRATISLSASPEHLAEGLVDSLRIRWGGKQYDVINFFGASHGIRITNQDGVILDLDLSVEDGENAGYLLLNGTRFGSISPLNGSLSFLLSDGSETVL